MNKTIRSRRSSWVSNAALQSVNNISKNEEQSFAKGDRVEVSLPCPGRSTEDVLTGFIAEDCFADQSKVTYSNGVELKLQFDDGLTSNVPKELIRHSTAPAPFKVSTPTNETVDHKEKGLGRKQMESPKSSFEITMPSSREFTIKRKRSLLWFSSSPPPDKYLKRKLQLMQNMTQKKRSLLWFSSSPHTDKYPEESYN